MTTPSFVRGWRACWALRVRRRRPDRQWHRNPRTGRARRNPDLLVVDIRMPPTNTTEGLDVARVIREEQPEIGILVLSAHVEVEHAMELLATGHAIGYLLKSRVTDVAEFVDSLQRIANGGSVIDPALIQELVSGTPTRRSTCCSESSRTRSAGTDGGGAHQRWHRPSAVAHRRHRREARAKHSEQAEPAGDRRRSSPCPSGDHFPRIPLTALWSRPRDSRLRRSWPARRCSVR